MASSEAHVRELARVSVWLHFSALVICVAVYLILAILKIEPSEQLDTALLALMAYAGVASVFQWAKDRRMRAILGSVAHALAEDSQHRAPVDPDLRQSRPRVKIRHDGYRDAPTVDLVDLGGDPPPRRAD